MAVGANNDTVGFAEIADCRTFLQEFWIGSDGELERYAALFQCRFDRIAHEISGTDWDCGLCDNDFEFFHMGRNARCDRFDIPQIGGTVLIRRRANCDKMQVSMSYRFHDVGSKA